jgi:hypothetical protein
MLISQKINGEIVAANAGEIDFPLSYDVVVVGLGTSGSVALIAAARRGLKVLGIERLNSMGGMGTSGSVNGYYFGSQGGLYETLDRETAKLCESVYAKSGAYNVEAKKYVLEQKAVRAGAKLAFEASITGVYLEGKQAVGLEWAGPGGIMRAASKIIIDCTGDAEVCAMAGCATNMGRELDNRTQPFTSVKVYAANRRVNWINFDSGCTDQTDGEALSRTIVFSHSRHLEERYEDGKQRMLYLAPLLGIREGRLIEGEETIRLDDFFADRVTDQPLFYAYADIDKHGRDHAFEPEELADWFVGGNLGAINVTVPVPLGAMIPRGFGGLMAAGRCLAVDHGLSTCVRMNRDMQKCGEAAATAAWLAIENGVSVMDVPYEQLVGYLTETGCYDPANNKGYQVAYPGDRKPPQRIEWMTATGDIRAGLASDTPGIAIWSAYRLRDGKIRETLREWQGEDDEALRKHSAFALGLLGDEAALPVLRGMLAERDSFQLKDCRKNNQMRGYMAIYLLGRLRDERSIDELESMVCEPGELDKPVYSGVDTSDILKPKKFNEIYFQFFSHAVMALLKIREERLEHRERVDGILKRAVGDGSYISRITGQRVGTYHYSIAENMKDIVQRKIG